MAKSAPPGRHPLQHRVPIRAPVEAAGRRIAVASAYPDRSGAFSDTGQAHHWSARERAPYETSRFSLAAPGLTYEPLCVTTASERSPAQPGGELRSVATPDPFRPDQSPLGAYHPAPGSPHPSVALVTEGPFVSSGGVPVSSTLADSPRHLVCPHGAPSCDVGRAAML